VTCGGSFATELTSNPFSRRELNGPGLPATRQTFHGIRLAIRLPGISERMFFIQMGAMSGSIIIQGFFKAAINNAAI
jgi:hypothetical protein